MTWHALSGLWTLVLPRSYARNRSEIKLLLWHLLKPLQHLCQDLIPHRALMLDLEPVVGREKGRANVAVIAYFDCLFACLFVFLSRKTWRASRVTWTVGPRWSALDSLESLLWNQHYQKDRRGTLAPVRSNTFLHCSDLHSLPTFCQICIEILNWPSTLEVGLRKCNPGHQNVFVFDSFCFFSFENPYNIQFTTIDVNCQLFEKRTKKNYWKKYTISELVLLMLYGILLDNLAWDP